MTGFVKVTLTIGVPVDAEYSPAKHAEDIIENAKRLFPTADVMVQDVQTYPPSEPKLIALDDRP